MVDSAVDRVDRVDRVDSQGSAHFSLGRLRNSDGHIPRASATAHPCACMACQQLVSVIVSFLLGVIELLWHCWAFAYAPARGFTASRVACESCPCFVPTHPPGEERCESDMGLVLVSGPFESVPHLLLLFCIFVFYIPSWLSSIRLIIVTTNSQGHLVEIVM